MSGYKCTKCGETASSKCVIQRSVFPSDQLATMIGNCFQYEANRRLPETETQWKHMPGDEWEVKLYYRAYGAQDESEAIEMLIKTLTANYPEGTMKRALCSHRWKIIEGECMFGCCKAS
jgi:hypothetical protein